MVYNKARWKWHECVQVILRFNYRIRKKILNDNLPIFSCINSSIRFSSQARDDIDSNDSDCENEDYVDHGLMAVNQQGKRRKITFFAYDVNMF